MKFFTELKRRNVYKVAVAYAVVGWLLVQIATQTFPFFDIPNWAIRLVILLVMIGFPIALVIAWAFELTPEGLKRTESVGAPPAKQWGGRAWIYVVIAGGLLSAGLFFLGRHTAPPPATAPDTTIKSIAVLPFENLSEDKANSYFVDGMQDEVITRLAKIAELRVISRTSTQRYKTRATNLAEIARELGVSHLVEGTVQRIGDVWRLPADPGPIADRSALGCVAIASALQGPRRRAGAEDDLPVTGGANLGLVSGSGFGESAMVPVSAQNFHLGAEREQTRSDAFVFLRGPIDGPIDRALADQALQFLISPQAQHLFATTGRVPFPEV